MRASQYEALRRSARSARVRADAAIERYKEEVERRVEALVEELTGAFIGRDTPEFQSFAAYLENVSAEASRDVASAFDDLDNEIDEQTEEAARASRVNALEEAGFSFELARMAADVADFGPPPDESSGRWRRFFSPYDFQRALERGLPFGYVTSVRVADNGLVYVELQ